MIGYLKVLQGSRISRWLGRPILDLAPPRPAPRIRGFSDNSPKDAREMRLIAQSAAQCNRAQRFTGCEHQALRHLDAPSCEVFMSGSAECAAENATELAFTKVQQLRQILDANTSAELRVDVHD